jgi:hypothetical protein
MNKTILINPYWLAQLFLCEFQDGGRKKFKTNTYRLITFETPPL